MCRSRVRVKGREVKEGPNELQGGVSSGASSVGVVSWSKGELQRGG